MFYFIVLNVFLDYNHLTDVWVWFIDVKTINNLDECRSVLSLNQ